MITGPARVMSHKVGERHHGCTGRRQCRGRILFDHIRHHVGFEMLGNLNRKILAGDILEKIREIPDESIDLVITSPPYWGQRDYGMEGQIGLEFDFHDYLKTMQVIMAEMKRVVKNTGTVWINMSDSYSGSGKGAGGDPAKCKESFTFAKKPKIYDPLPPKCRYGIPERFYIQCIDNGWVARNYIIWLKGNAKPHPVKDRFNLNWEPVFFFAKNPHHYFDLDPVREPCKSPSSNPKGKNPGAVFHINTVPLPEAHHATFPPELPMRIIKCACPDGGMILDPFMGSGSTALAAERLGRRWCGIELSPESIRIARKRLAKKYKYLK